MIKQTYIVTILGVAAGVALTLAMQNHPAHAQTGFGYTGGGGTSVTMSSATPNAQGISHAWAIDQRTNTVVFCRNDAAGNPVCKQGLLPGAAANPR